MRYLLILLCFLGFGAVGWHALSIGTDVPYLRGAPQIATQVRANAASAVAQTPALRVETDGRTVAVAGSVSTDADRTAVLQKLTGARLVRSVDDRIAVSSVRQTETPFAFNAERRTDGSVHLSGFVPNDTAKQAVLAEASVLADQNPLTEALVVADGAPSGDWTAMVRTGLLALGGMAKGTLAITDTTATVTGEVPDSAAAGRIRAALAAAPMGDWSLKIGKPPPEGGFVFNAMKTPDGVIVVEGHAPDPQTRDALLAAIADISGHPVGGSLSLAGGMPSADWPGTVEQAIRALTLTENGLLSMSADSIRLTGAVSDAAKRTRLAAIMGEGWTADIEVIDDKPANGTDKSTGSGAPTSAGTDQTDSPDRVLNDGAGSSDNTSGDVAAIAPEGPDTKTATADPAAALPELIVSKRADQIALTGVLPEGIDPGAVIELMGDTASGEGLIGGGAGSADGWQQGLTALADGLGLFQQATGRFGPAGVDLGGDLKPGYPKAEAQAWISSRMPQGWAVTVDGAATAAKSGDTRVNLNTGAPERYIDGAWQAQPTVAVSADDCRQQIDAILTERKITFLTGSAEIDERDQALVDRLADVTKRCLSGTGLKLRIEGHTDSSGNDRMNQRLSERRAAAVLEALAKRGIVRDAMTAQGFGETQPIADNKTRDGRAKNRRISFAWSKAD